MSPTPSPPQSLAEACNALWLATLSLMTAFMHNAAPAHRLLLARRIARNLDTLRQQDCFTPGTRASFAKLSSRWQARAERLEPAVGGIAATRPMASSRNSAT